MMKLIVVGPPTVDVRRDYAPVCQLPRRPHYVAPGRQTGELRIKSLYIDFEALERVYAEGGDGGCPEVGGTADHGSDAAGVADAGRSLKE